MTTGPKRKVGEFYHRLKRQIVMSELVPCQQLTELELANSLGCSQSTVREVLLRLQEDGLIVRQGYRGTSVASISPTEVRIFLDLRTRLEVEAIRLSLPSLLPEHIEHLRHLVREMEKAADDGDEYQLSEKDQEFHIYLFQFANLPALTPMLARYSIHSHRNKISQTDAPRTLQETAQRHWKIIAALEGGNIDEVVHVLQHHVRSITDAEQMKTSQTLPEMTPSMAAVHARTLERNKHLPDPMTLPTDAARLQFNAVNEHWNRIERDAFLIEPLTIPANPVSRTPAAPIPAVRLCRKGLDPDRLPHVLHIHGGGWVFGNNETHLGAMARFAELSDCAVVGIDYALAPEFPFPAGLNDCTWAWRWLRTHFQKAPSWSVMGDSAGANLALAMMLDLRHTGEALPEAGLLFYGVYAADHTSESHRLYGQGDFGLTSAKMAWYRGQYLDGSRRDENNMRVSPVHADLSDLPPLLITAAGLDPLRDDSIRLVERLSKTNTRFEFKAYPGLVHGFMQMGAELPEARDAFVDAVAFLQKQKFSGAP